MNKIVFTISVISLLAVAVVGCLGTHVQDDNENEVLPPKVWIYANVTHGFTPLAIQFNARLVWDTPPNDTQVYNSSWSFGDGSGSSEANASHTYIFSGSFDVYCVVTGDTWSNTSNTVVIVVSDEPAYDDDDFKVFIQSTLSGLYDAVSDISYYSSIYYLYGLAQAGETLYYLADGYYEDAITYRVSLSMQTLKYEYTSALLDSKQAGYYIHLGAEEIDAGYLERGANYLSEAGEHFDNAAALL